MSFQPPRTRRFTLCVGRFTLATGGPRRRVPLPNNHREADQSIEDTTLLRERFSYAQLIVASRCICSVFGLFACGRVRPKCCSAHCRRGQTRQTGATRER
eukprot:4386390-Pyramimonas_sp.AAC.1